MFECCEVPIELRYDCGGTGIDVQIELIDLTAAFVHRTHSPPKRLVIVLANINARQSVPLFVETVVPVPAALQPLDIDFLDSLIYASDYQQSDERCCCDPSHFSPNGARKGCRGKRGDAGVQDDGRRSVNGVQDWDCEQATCRGAGKIGCV